jgi:hypothetical protein
MVAARRTLDVEVIAMEPHRVIVIANQTACGPELLAEMRSRLERGPTTFTLVVPATPPNEQLTWTEGSARDIAERRLAAALDMFRDAGIDVTGVVGDASPMLAVGDLLVDGPYDEVILSTLPSRVSRWLKLDLPRRITQRFELPVTTVIGERASAGVASEG